MTGHADDWTFGAGTALDTLIRRTHNDLTLKVCWLVGTRLVGLPDTDARQGCVAPGVSRFLRLTSFFVLFDHVADRIAVRLIGNPARADLCESDFVR